ncbi:MAG: hypothetical protein PHU85_09400 [Phycisphaerae bacterium]|nr:hypothetical protein [Phycisphaerae bacterium]
MSDDIQGQIDAMRRRCNAAVFLASLRFHLAVGCVAAAVSVLAVRGFWAGGNRWLPLLGASAPVAFVAAWLRTRRRMVSPALAAGWLDRRTDAGGLLLALQDVAPESQAEWTPTAMTIIDRCDRPLPGFRAGRWLVRLLPWAAFLAAAVFVPQRDSESAQARFSTIGGQAVARLESKFEEIDKLGLLDEQERREVAEAIEKLSGEQAGAFDQKNWQALDAANERLDNRLAEARHALSQADRALDKMKGGASAGSGASPESAKQLAAALSRLAKSPLSKNAPADLKRQLSELEKRQAAGKDPLPSDPEELAKLVEDAKKFVEQSEGEMCQQGGEGEAGPSGQRSAGQSGGGGAGQKGLDDYDLPGKPEQEYDISKDKGGDGQGSQPPDGDGGWGRGGVNRGRGDAPMIWGDERKADGMKFKPRELPRGVIDQKTGQVVGVTVGNPQTGQPGSGGSGAAESHDPTAGGRVNRHDYSPAYRGAIRRYFSTGN